MITENLPAPNPQPYHICKVRFATQSDEDGRWLTSGAMIQLVTPTQQPGPRASWRMTALVSDGVPTRATTCLRAPAVPGDTEPRAVRRADGPGTGASEQLNSSSLKVPPVRAVGGARLSPWLAEEQEDSAWVTGNGVRLVAVHKPTRRQVTGKGTLL